MRYLMTCVWLLVSMALHADTLASIPTSGILFKDTIEVMAFDDPDIKGVTCYATMPKRSLSTDDQTDTAIACRQTGPISGNTVSRRKIFEQNKNWFFKKLYVDRILDQKRNALVYVSYTDKLKGDNASNSISVVVLTK